MNVNTKIRIPWKAMCAMGVLDRLGAIPRRADELAVYFQNLSDAEFLTLVAGTVNTIRSGTVDDSRFDCDLLIWSDAIKAEAERRRIIAAAPDPRRSTGGEDA